MSYCIWKLDNKTTKPKSEHGLEPWELLLPVILVFYSDILSGKSVVELTMAKKKKKTDMAVIDAFDRLSLNENTMKVETTLPL